MLGASLTVLGRRRPDRNFAAGVLISGGVLCLIYFGYSNVFGWLVPLHGYDGWLLDSANIGVGAGLALAAAGIALLLGPRAQPWRPTASRPARRKQPMKTRGYGRRSRR